MDSSEWRKQGDANAETLSVRLADLGRLLDRGHRREFWGDVKEVSNLFKTLKPIDRERREHLWSSFGALCERAKTDEERDRRHRQNISSRKKAVVQGKLNEAYWQAKAAKDTHGLRASDELLVQALEWMKAGWSQVSLGDDLLSANDGRMTKADNDECFERWKEIKETIKWRRKELGDYNYGHFLRRAHEALGMAEADPKGAREAVKQVQKDMKGCAMERTQFDEIRSVLDEAFRCAHNVQQKRAEEWRTKTMEARSRKLGRIERLRDVVGGIERSIDKCRDMQRDARTSEFSDRVQGWIDEKRDKIRDIESTIGELEAAVRDMDSKLSR